MAREHGDPLQYSVFVCDLSRMERTKMVDALKVAIDQSVDSIVLFDLGPLDHSEKARMVERLGPNAKLPEGGPTVV